MTEKKNLLPKLRFPEFRGDWESKNLGSVARLRNGYAFKSAEYVHDGPYQIITIANVQQGNLLIESTKRMAALPPDIQQHQVLSLEDILISMTGNVGRVCHVTDEGLLLNQRVGKLVPIEIDAAFFYQLLQRDEFRNSMQLKAAGGAQGNLSAGDITEYAFSVPVEPSEQQKIADCLSSLDELIAAQARKVDALKTHKKGLMQQLFPREGETQPRLRFPEFRDAEEWTQKALGDIADVLMCKRIFANETNPTEGVPFYKIGTLGGTPDAFISQDIFSDYKQRYNYPRLGEVLITCSGTIGKCLPFNGSDSYFQDSNIVWIDNSTLIVTNQFLLSILSSVDWSGLNSTTITRIYGPDLRGLVIKFPQDHLEQQRIANCLTALDDVITSAIQELATLKTHKKGLMQQLFPSAAELAA